MAQTLIGIVYDRETLALRRIILPDDDSEVLDSRHIADGEVLITSPRADGSGIELAMAAIERATGRTPPSLEEVHKNDEFIRNMNLSKVDPA